MSAPPVIEEVSQVYHVAQDEDLEKQQTKKAPEEFVVDAVPQPQPLEVAEPLEARPEPTTNDSHSEQTKVRDQGRRRKLLCCILVPLAGLVVMAVGAVIAYSVIMRPGKVRIDEKMSTLTQSLLSDPDFMFTDTSNTAQGYEKKIKLDLASTVLL